MLISNLQRRKLTLGEVKTFAGGQMSDGASTQIQVCLTTSLFIFYHNRILETQQSDILGCIIVYQWSQGSKDQELVACRRMLKLLLR